MADVLQAAEALIEFTYYAQYEVHTNKTLDAMKKALDRLHDKKDVFVRLEICEHFNFAKFHKMIHYFSMFKSLCTGDGTNTELPE